MAREWIVVWAGRHRRDRWDALCEEYRERVRHYMPVRELAVRARGTGDGGGAGPERLEGEGQAILAALPDPCRLIALDRDARPSSSESLAEWLVSSRDEWPHPVAFAVGSDLGLAPSVLGRAWRRLSFGPLTLPHELARLVLWEQLYRVSAIAAGSGYHRKSAGSLV